MNDSDKKYIRYVLLCIGIPAAFFVSLWLCFNFNIARKFIATIFLLIAVFDTVLGLGRDSEKYVTVEISFRENLNDFFPEPFTELRSRYDDDATSLYEQIKHDLASQ